MGIKNFLNISINGQVIKNCGILKKYSEFENERIYVDALNIIYRNMNVSKGSLLSFNGKRTHHIYIIIQQIIKFKKFGITSCWVFDSSSRKEKANCVKKRKENNKKYNVKPVSKEEIEDIKKILSLWGIPYIITNIDAEFVAACISKLTYSAGVYSFDTDVIARGGTLLKPVKEGIIRFDAEYIQKKLNVSLEDLQLMAVHLGCDFAEKTKGIGPLTVFAKKDKELTEEQKTALEIFRKPIDKSNIVEEIIPENENIEELKKFLKSLNFGIDILKKI